MVAAVNRVSELDPAVLRREAEERFSVERMVQGYLEAYETTIARRAPALHLSSVAAAG
jgi:hypothetical protein